MPLPWNPGLRHGHTSGGLYSRTYQCWVNMLTRCNNQNNPSYNNYGGRGIAIDPSWMRFEAFLADMGECPDGLSIERKDNNGNYTKDNCKWASRLEQAANTRKLRLVTFKGRTMGVAAWARELGMPVNVLYQRLSNLKWTDEEALSTSWTHGKKHFGRRYGTYTDQLNGLKGKQ